MPLHRARAFCPRQGTFRAVCLEQAVAAIAAHAAAQNLQGAAEVVDLAPYVALSCPFS